MHYIVYFLLDHFYVRTKLGPDWDRQFLVITQNRTVLDATPPALHAGVKLGMTTSEAKAVLDGSGSIIEWDPEDYREAQEAWLDVCADYTDSIEPLTAHEAFLDMSRHPQPGEVTKRLRKELKARTGFAPRVGEARSRWVAQLAARAGDPDRHALSLPELYVSNKPTQWLLSIPTELRQRLLFLGYRRIGEVADLSLDTLLRQFGDTGYAIWEAAQGHGDSRVKPGYPMDSLSVRLRFESCPEDTAIVERACVRLANRLGQKLKDADSFSHDLHLIFETDNSQVVTSKRTFIKPLHDSTSTRAAARLLLSSVKPREDWSVVRLRAVHLRKARAVQQAFPTNRPQHERQLAAENAVFAVRQVFGNHAIERASEKIMARRTRVLRAWKDATGWH